MEEVMREPDALEDVARGSIAMREEVVRESVPETNSSPNVGSST
jgi:hypothetical protein